jgi:hypothetical protein
MNSVTFIERMRIISNNKAIVEQTILNEFEKKKAERIDTLFKSLTFKYYEAIKTAIEVASTNGRQYSYMNFDRNDFKANLNTMGSPAKIQRKWLAEMCNPDSHYLIRNTWVSWLDIDHTAEKHECFMGLNYDVWDNEKFTTVFSWDPEINKDSMSYYHAGNWNDEQKTLDDWFPITNPIDRTLPTTRWSSKN